MDDETLWVEEINKERTERVIICVREDEMGILSFSSRVSPEKTAKIFTGLANYILENELG